MKFLLLVHFTGLALLGTTVLCELKSDAISKEPINELAKLEEVAQRPLKLEKDTLETLPQDEDESQESIERVYEPRLFHVVDVPDDENINLGQILEDFFGGDENEQEENFNREGRAKKIKNEVLAFNNDSAVISQYNGFIDAFLRQLTSTMKENSDPLTIILRKNFKITGAPKGHNNGNGPGALKDEDDDTLDDGPKRPKRPKGNKNRKRRKQKNRHPKDLNSDDAEEEDEIEGKILDRKRREVADEVAEEKAGDSNADVIEEVEEIHDVDNPDDDADLREGRDIEDEYDDMEEEEELEEDGALVEADDKSLTEVNGKALSTSETEVDEGRSDGNEIESRNRRNRRRRRKGGRKGKRRRGKCGKKCQRRRRRRMRIRRRNRNNRNRGKRSAGSAAILSGLSLIKRDGDVQIVQRENTQDIHANVEVGPVTLTAEKSFGEGDEKEQRISEAVAQAVKGKLIINISKDGNATVKAFKIFRPKDVSVSGSLRLDQSKTSDQLMKTYLTQSSPFVSKRLKAAANKVFGLEQPNKPKKNKNNKNGNGKNKANKNKQRN